MSSVTTPITSVMGVVTRGRLSRTEKKISTLIR